MHNINWKIESLCFFLFLLLAGFLGSWFGLLPWFLFMVSLSYAVRTIFQLQRIHSWLNQQTQADPPKATGLLGDVFDGVDRLQRQGKEEHLRLQAAVDYMQDAFSSLEDGIVMIDKYSNIEWSNAAAEKLLGVRYPAAKGQQVLSLLQSSEFIRYFDEADFQQSLVMTSPHNNRYQLQVDITCIGRGSRLLFARNITETNRLQKMRKDFVANVSHELRTPLTVINGYLEALADHGVGSDEVRWRRAIDQMLNQSHRMEALIKDLIMLSRLEFVADDMKEEVVNIKSMLEMICEEVVAAQKSRHKIVLECDDKLLLLGEYRELYSAFTNLVMNSVKYTPDKGKIIISWNKDRQLAYLEVKDNGEGIEAHHLPRLTERFYRVDKSRSIDTGGTGLGLAIVKHILWRHQADLIINSNLGEGSVFSCQFPLDRVQIHS
jgi:two-component system phosphate regulon sensor histidine kinase PhoR